MNDPLLGALRLEMRPISTYLLLLLCLFQTFAWFTSADRSETADYNNLGNFLSYFK